MLRYIQKPSEWLMLTAGVLILVSVPLIATNEQFMLWFGAKILYLFGVIVMMIER